MAEMFYKALDRRDFLQIGLGAFAAYVGLGSSRLFGKNQQQSLRLALLADTHITPDTNDNYLESYPFINMQKVVSEIAANPPDAVVIAGDLARLEGKLEDYSKLKQLLQPAAEKTPVFMALGNHDDRKNFYQVFKDSPGRKQPIRKKHLIVYETPILRMIIMDSLLHVNLVSGFLGKEQRGWLSQHLENTDDKPTIICLHHTLGQGDSDLLDTERFFRIIKPFKKVKAVIYGHSHKYNFSKLDGIHLINLPAVGYSFGKNVPVGWIEANLTAEGGNFKFHVIKGDKKEGSTIKNLKWQK